MVILDLRSGREKPEEVPPPRKYIRKKMPDHKGDAAGGDAGDVRISAEMLQQMLITAVQAGRGTQQADAVQGQHAAPLRPQGVDRKLIPQFWETRPAAWFRIFEAHVPDDGTKRFDYLLSFLSTTALNQIDSIVDAPTQQPYKDAKEALLSHFQRNKYDKASDLLLVTSLGDRTPSDLLRYMRSLQPGEQETSLFIVIFLNALPRNARDAALPKAPNLDEMAKAADIVLSFPEARAQTAAVQAVLRAQDSDDEEVGHVDAIARRQHPSSSSSSSSSAHRKSWTCKVHQKFKDKTYKCGDPERCAMRHVISPRPGAGNGPAGRQ